MFNALAQVIQDAEGAGLDTSGGLVGSIGNKALAHIHMTQALNEVSLDGSTPPHVIQDAEASAQWNKAFKDTLSLVVEQQEKAEFAGVPMSARDEGQNIGNWKP